MNIPLIVDRILKQPEFKNWSRRDVIRHIAYRVSCGGFIWSGDEHGNMCIMLGRPMQDGQVMFVDLMDSDSPELSLIALRDAVDKWDQYPFVAFERGRKGVGIRVYPPKFALRLARRLFREICNDGY